MTLVSDVSKLFSPSSAQKLASGIQERWHARHYPVPIGSIVKKEGIAIEFTRILSEGMLVRNRKNYIIKINETITKTHAL